jgi:type II secretory ATPase GspE/PulE/Tfp pilus assembly ATPase PilB-like protein
MGLPPFLVVSAVKGIMAQRLVRKTCTSCGGEGCAKCSNTRYKGRLAIHEILYIDDEISKAIMNKISTKELRNLAIKKGMITLYNDGLARVKEKVTTYEELMKVTCEEEI